MKGYRCAKGGASFMHKLTKFKIDELKIQYSKDREADWAKHLADSASRGMSYSSGAVLMFLEIGFKYINKLIDGIFSAEKTALSHEKLLLPENYYDNFKNGIIELISEEYANIRSKALERWGREHTSDSFSNLSVDIVNKSLSESRESINRRVEILKEEIRLGISTPLGATIHIGGDVGVVNTGVVYGSVHGKIEKMRDTELAKIFQEILDTIKNSAINEKDKITQIQNVEFLVNQYELPKEQRNYGVINTILNFLSTASNLALLWGQYGTALIDAFK